MLHGAVMHDATAMRAHAAFGQIEFFGEAFAEVSDEDQDRVFAETPCGEGFWQWLALDAPLAEHHTACTLMLEAPEARFTPGMRTFMERLGRSHIGLYEIRDVTPDVGLRVRDLWTREEYEVREKLATHRVVRHDVLGTRLVEGATGALEIYGCVYQFAPSDASALVRLMRAAWRRHQKKHPDAGEAEFIKQHGATHINRFWVHEVFLRPAPLLTTTDGERLEFCKTIFEVIDEPALRARLAAEPALDADDAGGYVWTNAERTILGGVRLERGRLIVETMNRSRAEGARELFERCGGDALRYRVTEHETPQRALEQHRAERGSAPRPTAPLAPEIEAAVIGTLDAHYRRWIDEPIPALGNRTPRHAAKLKTQRPTLIALIKQFESGMERDRRAGRPFADLSWMWRELGLSD